jgi:alcohol dehydrogenase
VDNLLEKAKCLLVEFKADRYAFGRGVLPETGRLAAQLGKTALVVGDFDQSWAQPALNRVIESLQASGVRIAGTAKGAAPNAPRDDLYRLQGHLLHKRPEVLVAVGGGSTIDACKAAAVLATLGDIDAEIDPYFGVGEVTRRLQEHGRTILPVVAVMTAASSGAHLTKYSNITDAATGQKKLIVDQSIVPPRAVFDHELTDSQPMSLTLDGALDGLSHCLEVYLGAKGDAVAKAEEIGTCGMELLIRGLKALSSKGADHDARTEIALGTDLGGYAIMVGGTSGPHLNSFSLVKHLTHGRACALMNPYYVVFFAPAIEDRLRKVGAIYQRHGHRCGDLDRLQGRDLGLAVAQAMIEFNQSIGFPMRLKDIPGMDHAVLDQALRAAKDPQLASKLQNMPIPLTPESVDRRMGTILEAAWEGELTRIEVGY